MLSRTKQFVIKVVTENRNNVDYQKITTRPPFDIFPAYHPGNQLIVPVGPLPSRLTVVT